MNRIAIVGSGGAGKTTLAFRLAAATGLPIYHMDRERWGPGWEEMPLPQWYARVTDLRSGERWIIDGAFTDIQQQVFARADVVVFLDYSRWRCLWRIGRRQLKFRRRDRPEFGPGYDHRLNAYFLARVWHYAVERRPEIIGYLRRARANGVRVFVFRSPKAAERWLRALKFTGAKEPGVAGG